MKTLVVRRMRGHLSAGTNCSHTFIRAHWFSLWVFSVASCHSGIVSYQPRCFNISGNHPCCHGRNFPVPALARTTRGIFHSIDYLVPHLSTPVQGYLLFYGEVRRLVAQCTCIYSYMEPWHWMVRGISTERRLSASLSSSLLLPNPCPLTSLI